MENSNQPQSSVPPQAVTRGHNYLSILLTSFVLVLFGFVIASSYQNMLFTKDTEITIMNQPEIIPTVTIETEDGMDDTDPGIVSLSYKPLETWQSTGITALGIDLCMPPQWEWDNDESSLYFNRDATYRPRVSFIEVIPVSGTTIAEAFIDYKLMYEYEANALKQEAEIEKLLINGEEVFNVSLYFGETLVKRIGTTDKLVAVESTYQEQVNSSPAAFQKDLYTIMGCIQPLSGAH